MRFSAAINFPLSLDMQASDDDRPLHPMRREGQQSAPVPQQAPQLREFIEDLADRVRQSGEW